MQHSSSRFLCVRTWSARTVANLATGLLGFAVALWSCPSTAAPPVANDDFTSTPSAIDSSAPFNTNALGNDFDPDGDTIVPISVQAISGGSPSIENGNEVWFTPSQYFVGTASFTYTIEANGETASATVTVDVLNRSPSANNCQDTVESGVVTQVLIICAEYPDPEQGPLTAISVTQPANGTAALIPGQQYYLEYVSNPGFTGVDSFQYTIEDEYGATSVGTITMTVTPFVNDPPVANDDTAQTRSGPTGGFPVSIDVLANDSDPDGDPLQYVNLIYTDPPNGTITRQGLLIYTPNAGFVGQDSFSYEIDDGNGGTDSAFVTITVTADQNPVAVNDAYDLEAFPADTEIDFLANDSDPDGDVLLYNNVSITTPPAHGQVSINCVGSCAIPTYQSQIGYSGPDSFTYTIDDGLGGQATATVSLNVLPSAGAPTATSDTANTLAGQAVSINVLANDTSGDGSPLAIESVAQPANGSVVVDSGGTSVTYTPSPGFSGQDTFTYVVTNDLGSDTGTVTIDVVPDNLPPVANADTATTDATVPVVIDVLANDTDPDQDPLTITRLNTAPGGGNAEIAANGLSITYTPGPGFVGQDGFEYEISDGRGGTALGAVTVTVNNRPPVAVDDAVTTNQDTPVTLNVFVNDSEPDGDLLVFGGVTQPANGSATWVGQSLQNGSIEYVPNAGFSGQDSFTYTVEDTAGGSATATVTVTVVSTNQPPVASDDSYTTSEGTPINFDPLANDSDPDGDTLTIEALTGGASNGTVVPQSDGSFTYTPNVGFVGTDFLFNYFVTDGRGGTAQASVSVTVVQGNAPPNAVDDAATTEIDTAVLVDVLANDSDPNGDALSIATAGPAANGTVTIVSGGIEYAPNAGFVGQDSFTYEIFDTAENSATATVTVTVLAGNAPPVAVNDAVATQRDQAVTFDPLANDTDPDGDALFLGQVGTPQNGTLVQNASGTLTYTPTAGFVGQDSFTYTAFDSSESESNAATVTITVAAPNSPPVAVNDSAVTDQDAAVLIPVLANDSDPDGDALQVSAVGAPANGTAQVSGNGVLYTPAAGFTGTDQFSYTVSDSLGASASATVSVAVNAIEPPALPTAVITGLLPLYPDTDGQPGETVTASGASSTAIEGDVATYVWSVNGTEVLRGPDADVSLTLPNGENTVELVVIDQGGLASEAAAQTVAVAAISSNENLTPNQKETAAALEDTCSSLVGSDRLTPEQQQLLETCRAIIVDAETPQEVESALDALSGEQVTAAQTSGIDFSSMQLTNIGSRIKALRSGARGVSIAGLNIIHEGQRLPIEQLGGFVKALLDADDGDGDGEGGGASGDDEPGGLFDDRLGLFMNGNVAFGEKDDTALEAGYDFDSIGLTLGADYRFTDNVVAGFAIGYGDSSSDFTQNRGKLDSNGYSGSVFASFYDQGGYIDGILSYGKSSFDALRRIDFTVGGVETIAEAKGDTDATTFGAGFSAGWDFSKGAFTFGPNVAVSYIEVDVNGYTETGAGGYNLIYDDQTGKSLTIRAGGHASLAFSGRWGVLTPQVRVDFVKELENDSQLVGARFAADPGSSGFVLATDVPDEEYLVWGLGLAGIFANGFSAFIDYQTVSSLDLIESHDFTIGLRYQRAFR
jgi:uncharacterized protein YhjY with autotransporter beta-barrel domain